MTRPAVLGLLCLWHMFAAQPAGAQSFPDQTVKIIVPSSPGGSIDLSARIVAEGLAAKWQRPVIIENRPGASMKIGAEAAAKSNPDGYTLLVAHDGTMAMNPVVYPDLRYDPQKDFEPVAKLSTMAYVLLVPKASKANSVQDLIDFATKNPGVLNHASGGTSTLLALELFKAISKIQITSVPFRGAAPALAALMGDQVDLILIDITSAQSALTTDRIKLLAVSSTARQPEHPNVPTMQEAGVKGYENETWMGMFAPKGTPPAVLAKLRQDVADVLQQNDIRKRFEAARMHVAGGGAEVMRATLDKDIKMWGTLVSERNIKITE